MTLALDGRELPEVPAHQLGILRRMGVTLAAEPTPGSLIIDAMIGYSLHDDPREPIAGWIDWANGQPSPTLALDLPSGLDASTGRVGNPCIVADATLTLALPKVGLGLAPQVAGALFVADISGHRCIYRLRGALAACSGPGVSVQIARASSSKAAGTVKPGSASRPSS